MTASWLYDLAADPGETRRLEPASMNGCLDRLRAALEHGSVAEPAPDASAATASPEELAAIERQMKLLGYM